MNVNTADDRQYSLPHFLSELAGSFGYYDSGSEPDYKGGRRSEACVYWLLRR
jgi:hypothetical protein